MGGPLPGEGTWQAGGGARAWARLIPPATPASGPEQPRLIRGRYLRPHSSLLRSFPSPLLGFQAFWGQCATTHLSVPPRELCRLVLQRPQEQGLPRAPLRRNQPSVPTWLCWGRQVQISSSGESRVPRLQVALGPLEAALSTGPGASGAVAGLLLDGGLRTAFPGRDSHPDAAAPGTPLGEPWESHLICCPSYRTARQCHSPSDGL